MTTREFEPQFRRLEAQFRRPADVPRATHFSEWFTALERYHVQTVERGITSLIRQATDTFWPAVRSLTDLIRGQVTPSGAQCQTCHGNTWVEARPFMALGRVYQGVKRCPDCGIPPPQYEPIAPQSVLTDREVDEWTQCAPLALPPARDEEATA